MVEIKNRFTDIVLCSGESIRLAVENAVDSGANLSQANLFGSDLFRANLSGAVLSGSDLSGSDLSGANLFGSDLFRANLSGSNLSGSNLSGANLSKANLSGSNLFGANLSQANLSGSNLSGANLNTTIGLVKIMGIEAGNFYWKRFDAGLKNNGYQFHVGMNKLLKGEIFADDDRILCSHPGFHFGSRSWCMVNFPNRPLEARICIPKGARINEPWATDGKASADAIKILHVFDVKTGEEVTDEYRVGYRR